MPPIRHLLSSCLLPLAVTAGSAFAATPAPIPVTVTNPVTVTTGHTPYAMQLQISMPNGQSSGSTNFSVAAGQHLVVQTISTYRGTSQPVGSGVHCFIGTELGGAYNYYSIPSAVADGSSFPGSSISLTFEGDPGSNFQVNCYRTDTSSYEILNMSIFGYLTPN